MIKQASHAKDLKTTLYKMKYWIFISNENENITLQASSEGLNSSLAQSPVEVCWCKVLQKSGASSS